MGGRGMKERDTAGSSTATKAADATKARSSKASTSSKTKSSKSAKAASRSGDSSTTADLGLNDRAWAIADELTSRAAELRIAVS